MEIKLNLTYDELKLLYRSSLLAISTCERIVDDDFATDEQRKYYSNLLTRLYSLHNDQLCNVLFDAAKMLE